MDTKLNEKVCNATAFMLTTFRDSHKLGPTVFGPAALSIIRMFLSEVMVVHSESSLIPSTLYGPS